jgi:hypothetical protein
MFRAARKEIRAGMVPRCFVSQSEAAGGARISARAKPFVSRLGLRPERSEGRRFSTLGKIER